MTARGSLLLAWTLAACAHKDPPPAAPAPPLPADPEVELASMQVECDALLAALATLRVCPNHDGSDLREIDAWIERASRDFAASRKANPEPNAQKAIAAACHKAVDSVQAATERCMAGPRPRTD